MRKEEMMRKDRWREKRKEMAAVQNQQKIISVQPQEKKKEMAAVQNRLKIISVQPQEKRREMAAV